MTCLRFTLIFCAVISVWPAAVSSQRYGIPQACRGVSWPVTIKNQSQGSIVISWKLSPNARQGSSRFDLLFQRGCNMTLHQVRFNFSGTCVLAVQNTSYYQYHLISRDPNYRTLGYKTCNRPPCLWSVPNIIRIHLNPVIPGIKLLATNVSYLLSGWQCGYWSLNGYTSITVHLKDINECNGPDHGCTGQGKTCKNDLGTFHCENTLPVSTVVGLQTFPTAVETKAASFSSSTSTMQIQDHSALESCTADSSRVPLILVSCLLAFVVTVLIFVTYKSGFLCGKCSKLPWLGCNLRQAQPSQIKEHHYTNPHDLAEATRYQPPTRAGTTLSTDCFHHHAAATAFPLQPPTLNGSNESEYSLAGPPAVDCPQEYHPSHSRQPVSTSSEAITDTYDYPVEIADSQPSRTAAPRLPMYDSVSRESQCHPATSPRSTPTGHDRQQIATSDYLVPSDC